MKKIALLFVITIISCSKKKDISTVKNTKTSWIEYTTKDSIPEQLKQVLVKTSGDAKLANSNEAFQATDNIINDSLPKRQLRLLARNQNHWRMTYVQGGIGKFFVYMDCDIENNKISNLRIAETLTNVEVNDSINSLLAADKLKFKLQ